MKTITIEIPDGKRAEWVDGVLTLVDEQPMEFKFKVGDKVYTPSFEHIGEVIKRMAIKGKPMYNVYVDDTLSYLGIDESELEPYTEQPKDITERIRTFEDACEWCSVNGYEYKISSYFAITDNCRKDGGLPKDVLAYIKLRIITFALNEGWKPTFEADEKRYTIHYTHIENEIEEAEPIISCLEIYASESSKLCFKSRELAEYAATQFHDIYMDFCYKGKNNI